MAKTESASSTEKAIKVTQVTKQMKIDAIASNAFGAGVLLACLIIMIGNALMVSIQLASDKYESFQSTYSIVLLVFLVLSFVTGYCFAVALGKLFRKIAEQIVKD